MKSAKIVKVKEPLKLEQVDKPSPKGPQVVVKVQSCGVCHSDIHLWEGGYEGPEGKFLKTTDRGIRYPLTPGHEVAGTVESVGEEVSISRLRPLRIRNFSHGRADTPMDPIKA